MAVIGWTVDTLATHIERQLDDMRSMLQERYATQTKAVDAAFLAQQTAMQTALAASEKAVQLALDAADRAAVKAEIAADKRFEVVTDKLSEIESRMNASLTEVTKRLDITQGRSGGMDKLWALAVGALIAIATVTNVVVQIVT